MVKSPVGVDSFHEITRRREGGVAGPEPNLQGGGGNRDGTAVGFGR